MRVDDKAKVLGDLFIKCTSCLVGDSCVPVDTRTPSVTSFLLHRLNQAPPDAAPSSGLARKEILQVADIAQPGYAAMKEVASKANEIHGLFRNERLDRHGAAKEGST